MATSSINGSPRAALCRGKQSLSFLIAAIFVLLFMIISIEYSKLIWIQVEWESYVGNVEREASGFRW